jgi:uncharacterized protein YqgC (DUF456 family)
MGEIEIKVGTKKERLFDTFKFVLGVLAILVGVAGLVLPILPGWIFIFIGLELLGIKLVFIDNIKAYVKQKIEESKKKGSK